MSITYNGCNDLVLCKHVHATNIVREVMLVFGFSWLVGNVMFDSFGKVSRNYCQGIDLLGCYNTYPCSYICFEVSQALGLPYA
jgi:hypothetical protein